jgi:hypothetical protein
MSEKKRAYEMMEKREEETKRKGRRQLKRSMGRRCYPGGNLRKLLLSRNQENPSPAVVIELESVAYRFDSTEDLREEHTCHESQEEAMPTLSLGRLSCGFEYGWR